MHPHILGLISDSPPSHKAQIVKLLCHKKGKSQDILKMLKMTINPVSVHDAAWLDKYPKYPNTSASLLHFTAFFKNYLWDYSPNVRNPLSIKQTLHNGAVTCFWGGTLIFDINRKSNRQTRLSTGAARTAQDIEPKYCDIHQYPYKTIQPTNTHQTPGTIINFLYELVQGVSCVS